MKNLNTSSLTTDFPFFKAAAVTDRFFKHHELLLFMEKLPAEFDRRIVGYSEENRSISLISWGKGPVKVFLWSQMHGDEATGTMALLDLMNFLQQQSYQEEISYLDSHCTLYLMPMVNPDGAERFSRRNALQIDLNRDFIKTVAKESEVLKKTASQLQPDYGFNLHDQNTLWSVENTNAQLDGPLPAALSLLAPAYDKQISLNNTRTKATQVIAEIYRSLSPLLPGQIGRFDDEFEPRSFGDNFQASGIATILLEAGGYKDDQEKQELRRFYFLAIAMGLQSIATHSFQTIPLKDYFSIPPNTKQIFHILIKDLQINGRTVSIGMNYREYPVLAKKNTERIYFVDDIGDLDLWSGYQIHDSPSLNVLGTPKFEEAADFDLFDGTQLILSFKKGILAV
ncbi:putative carboxypeptidase (putative secreted protein) [Pedobacter sp. BAL39]|uniref:M14 family zinc carboxypeptidase n=1 Tax=Pedobacter sp. BAL39 TaxID=391596 RepID=UPI00015593F9|nr:M14 family zinc carboxypeptidase [Pedobacter sp. BAL39]EDM36871.1 putative carboxypeptidase (putative secreted protein) [Pedobacter sp. BAL39]